MPAPKILPQPSSDLPASQTTVNDHFELLREIIAELTNTDPGEIWPEAQLLEDLNITDESLPAIVHRLNKEFRIKLRITDLIQELDSLNVQRLLNYIEEEIDLG